MCKTRNQFIEQLQGAKIVDIATFFYKQERSTIPPLFPLKHSRLAIGQCQWQNQGCDRLQLCLLEAI